MVKIKKIIHIGDIHIRTFKYHDEYKQLFTSFIDKVKEVLSEYNKDEIRIVIAGDLVHQKIVISNEQLMLGTWFLSELEKIAPLIIIAGNHDLLENNSDRLDSITPMVELLPDRNIKFFKKTGCYLDENIIWCVYSIFDQNSRPDINEFTKIHGLSKKYVGLFHGPLIGSQTDIGYKFEHGFNLENFEGCNFVLCADIHKRQVMTYNNIPIVYCGSLIQQDFGENINNHGFLLWDVETEKYTEINIDNPFGFFKLKISSIDDIDNNEEILLNG